MAIVKEEFVFRPPRRQGFIIHAAAVLILGTGGALGLLLAAQTGAGLTFLTLLLPAIAALILSPLLLYRLIALQRGVYILQRDGLRLYWGLRHEEIPMNAVKWVGLPERLGCPLPRNLTGWTGVVLGEHHLADGRTIEYLASRTESLVLIATAQRVIAISPADPLDFLKTYQRLAEFGTLTPIQACSVFPTFILFRTWADRPARGLLLLSTLLSAGLLAWCAWLAPAYPELPLRLAADGSALEMVPGVRILLLPVINTLFYLADLLLGLFFYRRAETQPLSYLMWGASTLTAAFFLTAVWFLLRAV
jgi:hypothetical protein